jgi:hypothetical protein
MIEFFALHHDTIIAPEPGTQFQGPKSSLAFLKLISPEINGQSSVVQAL